MPRKPTSGRLTSDRRVIRSQPWAGSQILQAAVTNADLPRSPNKRAAGAHQEPPAALIACGSAVLFGDAYVACYVPWCSKPKAKNHERVVIVHVPGSIPPGARLNASFQNQLITLASISGQGFSVDSVCPKPERTDDFARLALFVFADVIISDEA